MAFTFSNLKTELLNFGSQFLTINFITTTTGTITTSTYALNDIFGSQSALSSTIYGAPSAPTLPVTCSSATTGALPLTNSSSRITILGLDGDWKQTTNNTSTIPDMLPIIICDRLSHQAGLSANVSGTQSTNLPTAALTRYTDGVGVMIGLCNYSSFQAGTTASDITASYTNSNGVSGRTTSAVQINSRAPYVSFILPLQSGDIGVKSVESISLTAATGQAGNFGIFLFKPLATFLSGYTANSALTMPTGGLMGGLPEVKNDACLFAFYTSRTALATANLIVTEV